MGMLAMAEFEDGAQEHVRDSSDMPDMLAGNVRIMREMILNAFEDIHGDKSYKLLGIPRHICRAKAVAWIMSDGRSWPFSFLRICETLALSATDIRRNLYRPLPPDWDLLRRSAEAGAERRR